MLSDAQRTVIVSYAVYNISMLVSFIQWNSPISSRSRHGEVADAAAEAAGIHAMRAAVEADLTLEQVADEATRDGHWSFGDSSGEIEEGFSVGRG